MSDDDQWFLDPALARTMLVMCARWPETSCPVCKAAPGKPCTDEEGPIIARHPAGAERLMVHGERLHVAS